MLRARTLFWYCSTRREEQLKFLSKYEHISDCFFILIVHSIAVAAVCPWNELVDLYTISFAVDTQFEWGILVKSDINTTTIVSPDSWAYVIFALCVCLYLWQLHI